MTIIIILPVRVSRFYTDTSVSKKFNSSVYGNETEYNYNNLEKCLVCVFVNQLHVTQLYNWVKFVTCNDQCCENT